MAPMTLTWINNYTKHSNNKVLFHQNNHLQVGSSVQTVA